MTLVQVTGIACAACVLLGLLTYVAYLRASWKVTTIDDDGKASNLANDKAERYAYPKAGNFLEKDLTSQLKSGIKTHSVDISLAHLG